MNAGNPLSQPATASNSNPLAGLGQGQNFTAGNVPALNNQTSNNAQSYTGDLPPVVLNAFNAQDFERGEIPEVAPPQNLCF